MLKVMNTNKTDQEKGFTFVELLFGLVIIALIIFMIYIIFVRHTSVKNTSTSATSSSTGSSPSGKSNSTSPYAVLAPATVDSKVTECDQPITYGTNGSPTPIQCSNGNLNATAWNALSALEPTVMSLGYSATSAQVQTAICNDANAADEDSSANTSNAIEMTVYQISSLYYGWNFSSNPSVVLTNGTC
jgi:prepilin-type N-terminal cleavage/methylation domain-containing protein